jgi:hypothetical protein
MPRACSHPSEVLLDVGYAAGWRTSCGCARGHCCTKPATTKENRLLNQLHDNLAHCLIAARLSDAEHRRTGHRVTRARRLSRRADKASVRAQRLSRQAALAQRQVRLAGARTS